MPNPSMEVKQVGAVLVFGSDVSLEDARKALASIAHLLEGRPVVREFVSEYGGPVWYIP